MTGAERDDRRAADDLEMRAIRRWENERGALGSSSIDGRDRAPKVGAGSRVDHGDGTELPL